MRHLLIAALFISSAAWACPQLGGQYTTCRSSTGASEGSRDVVVSQSLRNRITTYTVTSTSEGDQERTTVSVIADGKIRTESQTDPESGLVFEVKTQASCKGTNLEIMTQTLVQSNELAKVTMLVSKSGNTLKQVISGHAMGNPLNDTVLCD